jgi:NADH-quinone oxidoreductase subunit L
MTHAFFKALLFLGAGSVIHALPGEQDMRNMGGLRKRFPGPSGPDVRRVAIAGVPPFSGFFSKDAILVAAYITRRGCTGSAWSPPA